MAVNPFVVTDLIALAKTQMTDQFVDKVVFNKLMQLVITGEHEVLTTLRDLMQQRSIDTAVGEQLDILGRIVGQERTLLSADVIKYFGFENKPLSKSFGTTSNPSVGGYWYSYGRPEGGSITLDDTQYRLFIKAKIKRNTTDATAESVMGFLSFVFGVKCYLSSNSGAKATIRVDRQLSSFERALVEYISADGGYFTPRPMGVELTVEEPSSNGTLGFLGTPFALGMISLHTISPSGGVFGSVYTEV